MNVLMLLAGFVAQTPAPVSAGWPFDGGNTPRPTENVIIFRMQLAF